MFKKYFKIFVILSLPLQVLLMEIISSQPLWVENNYSKHFYQYISRFLRDIFGGITVPVGQLLTYSIITALLFWLVRQIINLLKKRVSWQFFVRHVGYYVVAFLSGFYFLFNVMWALNYHRQPIQNIVNIEDRPVSVSELKLLCRTLISLTNQSRRLITLNEQQPLVLTLSPKQLLEMAPLGFAVVSQHYPEFTYVQPAIKQVYVPELMSFFGVSGIYFPFTGEANVNMDPPAYLLPEVICHEMAHQIGFASEDEANYVAYLVCRLNPEPAFQYSANFTALKYAMNRLKQVNPGAYKILEKSYSPGVRLDLEQNRIYWEKFQNPIEVFTDGLYDLFLKVNDQEDGIKSYSRVVELLMGEYRKNGLQYQNSKPVSITNALPHRKIMASATDKLINEY